MPCEDLLPPSPPTLEQLPSNVKMPKGFDANKLKSMASGGGLSGAMNSVSGLVGSGLKQLSPDAIAGKVDELVGGISDTISSTVNDAIGGIASLKNRIKSFDPSAQLSKLAGAPGAIMDEIKGQLNGFDEFSNLQGKLSSGNCAKEYVSEAGAVTNNMKQAAAAASNTISKKDRLRMAQDENFKMEKERQVTEQVTESVKQQATSTATAPDKANKDSQSVLQSDQLETQRINNC